MERVQRKWRSDKPDVLVVVGVQWATDTGAQRWVRSQIADRISALQPSSIVVIQVLGDRPIRTLIEVAEKSSVKLTQLLLDGRRIDGRTERDAWWKRWETAWDNLTDIDKQLAFDRAVIGIAGTCDDAGHDVEVIGFSYPDHSGPTIGGILAQVRANGLRALKIACPWAQRQPERIDWRKPPRLLKLKPPRKPVGLTPLEPEAIGDVVYFIQMGEDGDIKIGTTANIHQRFRTLQTACHKPLRVLAMLRGGAELEEQMHRRFAHLRTHLEWFRPGEDLMEFLVKIRSRATAENNA